MAPCWWSGGRDGDAGLVGETTLLVGVPGGTDVVGVGSVRGGRRVTLGDERLDRVRSEGAPVDDDLEEVVEGAQVSERVTVGDDEVGGVAGGARTPATPPRPTAAAARLVAARRTSSRGRPDASSCFSAKVKPLGGQTAPMSLPVTILTPC